MLMTANKQLLPTRIRTLTTDSNPSMLALSQVLRQAASLLLEDEELERSHGDEREEAKVPRKQIRALKPFQVAECFRMVGRCAWPLAFRSFSRGASALLEVEELEGSHGDEHWAGAANQDKRAPVSSNQSLLAPSQAPRHR